jgi:prepilin-type N-terminal cleavage/methylation domain-containing protein
MRPTIPITANPCPGSSASGISDQRGLTLIEILITLFILSVGILATARLQADAIRGDTKAERLTLSSHRALSLAESLSGLPFDAPDLADGLHGPLPHPPFWIGWSVTPDLPLPALTRDADGSTISPISISKTITIVVFDTPDGFNDPNGNNRTLTLSLVKTRSLSNP